MFLLTGGAGFIGSNYARYLNSKGINDIFLVDNFNDGRKFNNINDLYLRDVIQKEKLIENNYLDNIKREIKYIIHLGACSSTQEMDGKYLLENNYEYSKTLLDFAIENKIDFLYASSASVYGLGENGFKESLKDLKPINPYAFSKKIFDDYVIRKFESSSFSSNIKGLRFFNVYGPGENLKFNMSSPIYKFFNQINEKGYCNLFSSYGGYEAGMHLRDFIHVDDCCKVIEYLRCKKTKNVIFNVGTGKPTTFMKIAEIIVSYLKLNKDAIKFIPFPDSLKGKYQSFTCADLTNLIEDGFCNEFIGISDGIKSYISYLNNERN